MPSGSAVSLAFAVGLLVLRPFAAVSPARTPGDQPSQVPGPADDQRRELLRQLRDLDDDLAAGKLSSDDPDGCAARSSGPPPRVRLSTRGQHREGQHRQGQRRRVRVARWPSPPAARLRTPAAPGQWGAGAAGAPCC
jgi:hypothetical protein